MSSNSWNEFVGGFLSGFASSALVGWYFYKKQLTADEKEQRELTLTMYTLWKQGGKSAEIISRIEEKLDGILSQPHSIKKMNAIDIRFQEIEEEIRKAYRKKSDGNYVELVAQYKLLADARADEASDQLKFSLLDKTGSLTIDSIKDTHKGLFPADYAWSGKFRDKMQILIGNYAASARAIPPSLSSYQVNLLEPQEIFSKLQKLIDRWNSVVTHLRSNDHKSITFELAHFHHDFLFIHPFVDGNGRIARVILNEQASFLTGKLIKMNFELAEYYQALHLADLGGIETLQEIISKQIN